MSSCFKILHTKNKRRVKLHFHQNAVVDANRYALGP